ncbi:MAG: hypothetical protein DWH88_05300 [Planctomycetota bacterium]|nr:MAG: hypothetical protein DWH88_05300 [Planctomycetota bacterium]
MGRKWATVVLVAALAGLLVGLGIWIRQPRDFADEGLVRQAMAVGEVGQMVEGLAGEWPQWRGPKRDGQMDSESARGLLAGKPAQRWETELGEGYASPVLVGGQVIALARKGTEEFLQSFDLKTGASQWLSRWPCSYKNDYGNGPRASPTVSGNLVFALGAAGRLVAVQLADGQMVWQADLLGPGMGSSPRWGFAGSPLVVGELVIVQVGAPSGVVAFDRATGEEKWRSGGDPAGYSSPLLVRAGGGLQLVCLTGRRLLGMDPANGEILWQEEWPTEFEVNAATPVVWTVAGEDGETLYAFVTSGYGRGCCLMRVNREKEGKFWNASMVYRNTRMRSHFGSPVRVGDLLWGFDEQMVTALDWRTGEARVKKRGYKKGTLVAAGENLLLLSEEGELALAKFDGKELKELWRMPAFGQAGPMGKKAWTMPVAAAGVVLVRDEGRLICLEMAEVGRK